MRLSCACNCGLLFNYHRPCYAGSETPTIHAVLCLTGVRNNKCKTPFHTRLPVFFGDPVTLTQPEPTQRRQEALPAVRSPSLLLALGSFMQILVDLVMNERSVRRPHALDPGHDLPLRREISLTIATVYPVPPPESRSCRPASPPPAPTRCVRSECHCPASTSSGQKRERNSRPTTNAAMVKDYMSEIQRGLLTS